MQRRDRGLCEGLATLCLSAVTLIALRLQLMGSKAPEFAPADNPSADCRSRLTRALTFLHLPVFNGWLLVQPSVLSFDWSMEAIPLISSASDGRNWATAAFYAALAYAAWKSLWGGPMMTSLGSSFFHRRRSSGASETDQSCGSAGSSTSGSLRSERTYCAQWRPACDSSDLTLVSLALMVLPFMPATNLFFYVGFVVAERVLYIPSMGYCLLVALGCHVIDDVTLRQHKPRARTLFRCVLLALLVVYSARTVRRNQDWLTEESLYRSGIHINPPKGSFHTNHIKHNSIKHLNLKKKIK